MNFFAVIFSGRFALLAKTVTLPLCISNQLSENRQSPSVRSRHTPFASFGVNGYLKALACVLHVI